MTISLKKFNHLRPLGIKLLAVSKGKPSSAIRSLALEGQIDFGESKLQEALIKIEDLTDFPEIRWHFIGPLQKNKVRGVIKAFHVIHSVDSLKLAQRISRICSEEHKNVDIMIQVKLREDPAKQGFSHDNLLEVWAEIMELPNIQIKGLMTIAPIELDLSQRKDLFKDCRSLADKLGLKDCSMGMSQDWQVAIEAGSTWVRLGSSLFGERHK